MRTTPGHRREWGVRRLDDEADTRVDLGQVCLGHDAGDFDDLVEGRLEAGHLAVDPHESVSGCHGDTL